MTIEIDENDVKVWMSLTTPMCPVAPQIVEEATQAVQGVEGVENAEVQLTFDPPWTPERIAPLIRSSAGCATNITVPDHSSRRFTS